MSILRKLLATGASALVGSARRRLARLGDGRAAQHQAFAAYCAAASRTRYGRDNGITANLDHGQFQARVPLRTYEDLHPYVEDAKRGAADVLWPGRCLHYAVSSGTTAGRTKYIPVTREMQAHFSRCGLDSLLFYANRAGRSTVFEGRHLFLGGSTTLTPLGEGYDPDGVCGDLSGITALNMPSWADRLLYEPGLQVAQIGDWPSKLRAIVDRCAGRDIRLVAGIPTWAMILFEHLRAGKLAAGGTFADMRSVWPHLECFIHGGVPIGPFTRELRRWLGEDVRFHEVYPASEGFIAVQDDAPEAGMRLLVDAGVFFEFLPMDVFDESRLGELGPQAVPLEHVRTGVNYALVMTTPAGLCRYVIGDVVQFTSRNPPRLVYAGRTKLALSAFGEHVIEKELTDALQTVAGPRGWEVANFHVAPLLETLPDGRKRARHQWFIELRSGACPEPAELAAVAASLDADLIRANDDYEAKRKGGGMEPPDVCFVPAGTFEAWLKRAGKWGGQNKMPRCRSDRQVADGLVELARR